MTEGIEAWRKADATHRRKQRQQRGRRRTTPKIRAGMIRLPIQAHDDGVDAQRPRCPFPACPVRWRTGEDRPCADHQPASQVDAAWMAQITQAASGDDDGDLMDSMRGGLQFTEGNHAPGRDCQQPPRAMVTTAGWSPVTMTNMQVRGARAILRSQTAAV